MRLWQIPEYLRETKTTLLDECIMKKGPVNVTETVARIKVCGRCGYDIVMHKVISVPNHDPASSYLGSEGDGSLENSDIHPISLCR